MMTAVRTQAKLSAAKIVCIAAVSVILAIVIALNVLSGVFAEPIDALFDSSTVSGETRAAGKSLAEQIEAEGIVLAENRNVLPLDKTQAKKVNVFGWGSRHWVKSGSGSGQANVLKVDLIGALEEYGIEVNRELSSCYDNFFPDGREFDDRGSLNSKSTEFSRLYEPSITDTRYYPANVLSAAKSFSDVAFVVLGRITGESNDCPRSQYKYNGGELIHDETRTYLDISTEEEALLTYVGKNYKKVIVMINSTNAMNLSFMHSIDGLGACMIVGGTGAYGAAVIPKLVYGEISPSGRTVDTYPYAFETNPSYATTGAEGLGVYTNGGTLGLYPYNVRNGNIGRYNEETETFGQVSFLDYTEGIYVGYKWYETADAEGYWNGVDNKYGKGYAGVVQYPFGYGLSYTTFEWAAGDLERERVQNADGTDDYKLSLSVTVTNTGSTPGRDVVQLYYTPPYTPGGIEKSAVNLCAFGKTGLLAPGESERINLSFLQSDMASYDYSDANGNHNYGYELEKGVYTISLRNNSHEVASTKVVRGKAETEYRINADIKIQNDPVTGNPVVNRFSAKNLDKRNGPVDGLAIDGTDIGANIKYMTRADFAGTFPSSKTAERELPAAAIAYNVDTAKQHNAWEKANSDAEEPTMGAKNGIRVANDSVRGLTKLGRELGANYDDPRWEQLLDQLTYAEMVTLVKNGTYYTEPIRSIGMPKLESLDGPSQFGSWYPNLEDTTVGFPMPTVIAQTWNRELARSMGLSVGNEVTQLKKYAGWYGPGINIHRSAFGGRNYEYYSEDPLISGIMCANTVAGAKDAGVFCFIKHLALYNQDSFRDGAYCWLTEQNLRETYLKPFRIAIQQGGATGLMSEYGRIGAVWAGGSRGLITCVLREEFGFKGTVITDYADDHQMMSGDAMIRAGGDLWMSGADRSVPAFKYEKSAASASNAFKQQIRSASKNIIYTWLNAVYTNSVYDPANDTVKIESPADEPFPVRITLQVVINIVAALGCGFWVFWAFYGYKLVKKNGSTPSPAGDNIYVLANDGGDNAGQESPPKLCPHCGTPVEEGERFCGECGGPLGQAAEQPLCPHCGAPMGKGETFCGECGRSVDGL